MPLVAQHGVVLLPTLLTPKGHFVGVVSLEVVFQVVFPVECLLTVSTLVRLLGRMGRHVPTQRQEMLAPKWSSQKFVRGFEQD